MSTARKHAVLFQALVLVIFWVGTTVVAAGQGAGADAETQFGYAERLYADGEYFLAASEYKRFIYRFPGHGSVETAMYKVGMCYLQAGSYADSITSFKKLIRRYPEGRYSDRSHFRISEGYARSDQAGAAITSLRNLTVLSDDVQVRDEAYYRMGWIYVRLAQWEQAQKVFDLISQDNRTAYRLQELSTALAEEQQVRRKSPTLAGTLAIIPGGGYLYCGRYQDALIALLVNGGLIWAAYESFSNELYALGSVITFVELGFYAGNIYGSVASAHKFNRKNERRWIENLRKNLKVSLASRYENRGLELSLRYTF
ncbi:MAG: tetratricopeptide repeat protein [Deltaproteobacteria bacterium]|nr:tetratricopeptide repeat protein [Deltaproteobacteria bacterium]